ncbi:PAS domain S-box protein [Hansschlegelia quercus]|uniref:sensor histidine kinase n=1 Tax=Hansschlegelia quercus TaxID=2528245 RepID=UPI0013EF3BFD|nr:PAS domain S-box protein [Hansschlegelia quercus]
MTGLESAAAPAIVVDRQGAIVWANEAGRALDAPGGLAPASRAAVARVGASGSEGLARLRVGTEKTARIFRTSALDFDGAPCILIQPVDEQTSEAETQAEAGPASVAEEPAAPPAKPARLLLPVEHLRFIFEIDSERRLAFLSPDLAEAVGESAKDLLGQNWVEIEGELGLDPEGVIASCLESRKGWSDVAVDWPAADGSVRLLLSALPIFDNGEVFVGFRGLGRAAFAPDDGSPVGEPDQVRETEADEEPTGDEFAEPEAAGPEPESFQTSAPEAAAETIDAEPEQPVWIPPVEELPAIFSAAEPRDALSGNVVPLRDHADMRSTLTLSAVEESAFDEIARRLSGFRTHVEEPDDLAPEPAGPAEDDGARPSVQEAMRLIDRLALGVLVLSGGALVYANRAALEMTGAPDLEELVGRGPQRIFAEPRGGAGPASLRLASGAGDVEVEARLVAVFWRGRPATLVSLKRVEAPNAAAVAAIRREGEITDILDTATDGVMTLDSVGRIVSVNRSMEALFGFEAREVIGSLFTLSFAPESRRAALDYLDGLKTEGVGALMNHGCEVLGLSRDGGAIPLFLTIGRIGDGDARYCAVLRDITPWKKAEEQLLAARRQAERTSAQKSDFLTRVGREIRTPLNAMIGFAEVMEEERFGPIGSPRYKDYLRDIRLAGRHLVGLVDDLVDLANVESGGAKLDLAPVDLNDIASQAAALMQPQANRDHVIIRTSLARGLPQPSADQRSVRQMLSNLIANAVRNSKAGGQVIVATSVGDLGQAVIRVRDSGAGMSRRQIALALEPFRPLGDGDGSLDLPIVKALAEANDASFEIHSEPGEGTVVELTFPANRAMAV